MRKRRYLFTGMAVVLLFTILFAAGYTTPAIGNVNTVQAATKKKHTPGSMPFLHGPDIRHTAFYTLRSP